MFLKGDVVRWVGDDGYYSISRADSIRFYVKGIWEYDYPQYSENDAGLLFTTSRIFTL